MRSNSRRSSDSRRSSRVPGAGVGVRGPGREGGGGRSDCVGKGIARGARSQSRHSRLRGETRRTPYCVERRVAPPVDSQVFDVLVRLTVARLCNLGTCPPPTAQDTGKKEGRCAPVGAHRRETGRDAARGAGGAPQTALRSSPELSRPTLRSPPAGDERRRAER